VLLVFGAPCQLRLLAGQERGRTIPLADMRSVEQLIAILVRKHPAPPYPDVLYFELHGGVLKFRGLA
jgi:hypothetical protein